MSMGRKLAIAISMFCLTAILLMVGIWAVSYDNFQIGGTMQFNAHDVNVTITGTVTGAKENPTFDTLVYTSTTVPEESALNSWKNKLIEFTPKAEDITIQINVINNGQRGVRVSISDYSSAIGNLLKTYKAGEDVYAMDEEKLIPINGSLTFDITFKVDDIAQDIGRGSFMFYINLADERVDKVEEVFTFLFDEENKTAILERYKGTFSEVVVPAEVQYNEESYTVTGIGNGNYVFAKEILPGKYKASNLTSVVIPETVTSIGNKAFALTNLESIDLPESVGIIGSEVFVDTKITEIIVPKNVYSIQGDSFSGCSTLNSLSVHTDNINYRSLGNCIYNYSGTLVAGCPTSVISTDSSYATSIGENAFKGCSLTQINIPNNVTSIENSAFLNSSIMFVEFSSALKQIGNNAFKNTGLTIVEIPDSVTSLGESAFQDCDDLTSVTIGDGVIVINMYAFRDCPNLETVTVFSSDLVNILGSPFYNASESLKIYVPTGSLELYKSNWVQYKTIILPMEVYEGTQGLIFEYSENPSVATLVGYDGEETEMLIIPENVEYIGQNYTVAGISNQAFADCGYIKKLVSYCTTPPTIPVGALNSLTSLQGIYVPSQSVTSYKTTINSAWYENSESIYAIENHLGTYGLIFKYLENQAVVVGYEGSEKEIVIPSKVTYLGEVYNVNKITEDGASVEEGAFYNKLITSVRIPDSIQKLNDYSFYGCSVLQTITLPYGNLEIGKGVFAYCYELKDISLPTNLTTIDEMTFYNCDSLTRVTIPGSVQSIGENAFGECNALAKIIFETPYLNIPTLANQVIKNNNLKIYVLLSMLDEYKEAWPAYSSRIYPIEVFDGSQGLRFHYNEKNWTASLFDFQGGAVDVVIPSTITYLSDEYTVTAIESEALDNKTSILSVVIPETISDIGSSAFLNCSSLSKAVIYAEEPPTMATGVFDNCNSELKIYVPNESWNSYQIAEGWEVYKTKILKFLTYYGTEGTVFEFNQSDYTATVVDYLGSEENVEIYNFAIYLGDRYEVTNISRENATIPEMGAFYRKEIDSVNVIGTIKINDYAFYACSFKSIDLGYSSFGKYAFAHSALKSINLSTSSISDYAFYNCYNLETITGTFETIGEYAFANCKSLTELYGLYSATNIKSHAFYNCDNLEMITLETSNLQTIGEDAFGGCDNLTKIIIKQGTPPTLATQNMPSLSTLRFFVRVDNLTAYKTAWPEYKDHIYPILTHDGTFALNFRFNENAKTATVVSYHGGANELKIPENVTYLMDDYRVIEIEAGSLKNLLAEKLDIPKTIIEIGDDAFSGCENLEVVIVRPYSVPEIGENIFGDCENLAAIYVPNENYYNYKNQWTDYKDKIYPFVRYSGTPGLKFEYNYQDFTATVYLYNGLDVRVTVPETISYCGQTYIVTQISREGSLETAGAFASTALVAIDLPNTITKINQYSFYNCKNLKEVGLKEGLLYIGDYAFANCTALKELEIPTSVTEISSYAFYQSGLAEITIPEGVTYIGNMAISGCEQLKVLTSLAQTPPTLGNQNITCLEDFRIYVLQDCLDAYKLAWSEYEDKIFAIKAEVTIDNILVEITPRYNEAVVVGYTNNSKGVTVPATAEFDGKAYPIVEIDDYAFQNCTDLPYINFSEGLLRIGQYAFQNCSSLTYLNLPDTLQSIDDFAFQNCTKIPSISIGENVVHIGKGIIAGCEILTAINVDNNNGKYESQNKYCVIDKETNTLIVGCPQTEIPDSVESIEEYAFYNCIGLIGIKVPASVTKIGSYAFYECPNLVSFEISGNVISVGASAFQNCKNLKMIICGGEPAEIGEQAFAQSVQSNLTIYVLPDLVNTYKQQWSEYTNNILAYPSIDATEGLEYEFNETTREAVVTGYTGDETNLVIPSTVVSNGVIYRVSAIEDYALRTNDAIQSVTISIGTTMIGFYSFAYCESLTEVNLPLGLLIIEQNAFTYCPELTEIEIPDSVTIIGANAFKNCSTLDKVVLNGKIPPKLGSTVFNNCSSELKILVPALSLDTYKNEYNWKNYGGKIFPNV